MGSVAPIAWLPTVNACSCNRAAGLCLSGGAALSRARCSAPEGGYVAPDAWQDHRGRREGRRRVAKGQRLLVMEAMKMEHAIRAGTDGVVEAIEASVGAQVDAGQVLVVVRRASDELTQGKRRPKPKSQANAPPNEMSSASLPGVKEHAKASEACISQGFGFRFRPVAV